MTTSVVLAAHERIQPSAEVLAHPGPLLLRNVGGDPGLKRHLQEWGPQPRPSLDRLIDEVTAAGVSGRGGAGFPLARKLATVADHRRLGRRPVVVVNAAEGEPVSAKDSALLMTSPHLVLDGAAIAAHALGAREIHVVTGLDRPWVGEAVDRALAERVAAGCDGALTWSHVPTVGRFVSGQAQAVLEHLAGRAALPVTAWVPEAVRGVRGRPTLLSNAETCAHVGALSRVGLAGYRELAVGDRFGTTLLTVAPLTPGAGGAVPLVHEVGLGSQLSEVVEPAGALGPVLLGGYHGTWASAEQLAGLVVDREEYAGRGLSLGAGVVAPAGGVCPVALTAQIVDYLAGESAGRCGPCRNGLPALAVEVAVLARGVDSRPRLSELCGLVERRGACAHPDGTARLVRSLLAHLPQVVESHLVGGCTCSPQSGRGPGPAVADWGSDQ